MTSGSSLNLRNRSRLVNNKNEFTSLGHISNRTTSAGEIHDLGSQTDQIETPDQIALKSIVSLQVSDTLLAFDLFPFAL